MDKPFLQTPGQMDQSSDRLIYLVTEDQQLTKFLSQQIIHFGYSVQQTRDIQSLAIAIAKHHSVAVIVDLPSQKIAIDLFEEISGFHKSLSPYIFISNIDDQDVRLNSIRVGGVAFFSKPVNIIGLIDKLDSLDSRANLETKPNRVLIIENQVPVASYYQMILKMSGLDAQFVTDSKSVLGKVRDFYPDLILVDTFMPEIKGADLARIIRQIDDFVSVPIIFLSSEDDFAKRIEALDIGGDDFLIKPIRASHLIAVVKSRIERSKTLRSYMVRDSLTNLLNHTTFRSVLKQEVSRSKRQESSLALAMLDLDHFKRVNDSYGHATGDRVLKSLSRLLRQRLRKSDIVGRYGGEEFVALLLDCEAEQALPIMDEIRLHFSKIEFYPKDSNSLSVTFSCGISTFPKYNNAQDLSDASDQALYAAKNKGRNKVIVAQS